MTFSFARLFRTVVRLDQSGGTPPWPLQVWNPDSLTWDAVCAATSGGSGVGGTATASSLLVRARRPIGVLGDYLSTASGELVVTASGEPVTLGALRVYEVPEFVLTADGDLIGVAGR